MVRGGEEGEDNKFIICNLCVTTVSLFNQDVVVIVVVVVVVVVHLMYSYLSSDCIIK